MYSNPTKRNKFVVKEQNESGANRSIGQNKHKTNQ